MSATHTYAVQVEMSMSAIHTSVADAAWTLMHCKLSTLLMSAFHVSPIAGSVSNADALIKMLAGLIAM